MIFQEVTTEGVLKLFAISSGKTFLYLCMCSGADPADPQTDALIAEAVPFATHPERVRLLVDECLIYDCDSSRTAQRLFEQVRSDVRIAGAAIYARVIGAADDYDNS